MYYWASHELGHKVDEIGLYFLRHSEYKTTTRTDDSTLELFKDAITIERAFNQEDLMANYSTDNCKWCGFKDECDAWKNKTPKNHATNLALFRPCTKWVVINSAKAIAAPVLDHIPIKAPNNHR